MRTHRLVLAAAPASLAALPSATAEVPHGGQHLTSRFGTQANTSERGPAVWNAPSGRVAAIDKSRPHVDVTSPSGALPSTGSEQGANPRNGR